MKKTISTLVIGATFLTGTFLITTGCESKEAPETHEHMEGGMHSQDGPHSDADHDHYNCPMHPEVTGAKGDNCSKCGMTLEPMSEEEMMNQ